VKVVVKAPAPVLDSRGLETENRSSVGCNRRRGDDDAFEKDSRVCASTATVLPPLLSSSQPSKLKERRRRDGSIVSWRKEKRSSEPRPRDLLVLRQR